MPTRIIETFTAELMAYLMEGLKEQLHADYKNHQPDPRLKSNYTARGCEAVVEFKGQFYHITVKLLP